MAQVHRLEINISGAPGAYQASVTRDPLRVKPGHDINWKVNEPDGFPRDAVVFLQFYENIDNQKVQSSGCLEDGDKYNGKQPGKKSGANDHRVDGRTRRNARGNFLYEIFYSEGGNNYLLLDPEIIVEGDPPRGVVKKKTAKKKAVKKSAAKKSGKKASKATGRKTGGKTQAAKRRKASKRSNKAKKTAKRRAAKKR